MAPADENRTPGTCPGWCNGCGSRNSAWRMGTTVAGQERADQGFEDRRGQLHPLQREPVWCVTDQKALESTCSADTRVPGPEQPDTREQGRADIGAKARSADADVAQCRGRRDRGRLPTNLHVQVGPNPVSPTMIHRRASGLAGAALTRRQTYLSGSRVGKISQVYGKLRTGKPVIGPDFSARARRCPRAGRIWSAPPPSANRVSA